MLNLKRAAFLLILLICFSGFVSPPFALALGILFGLFLGNPFLQESRNGARVLLQVAVVALGFGLNFSAVLRAGRSGFLYTALGILFALAVGLALGKLLNVCGNASYLTTVGTAICGGSAIAAIAPILHADDDELTVSLGTVFILNSIALFIFPPLGHLLVLSQSQFGLWAALAIHDTSSVVGAASRFGPVALEVGTTVKLARALWIVPLAVVTAAVTRSKMKVQIPWFILCFCFAAALNTYLLPYSSLFRAFFRLGRLGLTATLFLIGSGISQDALRRVGWRPLAQGLFLWAIIGSLSLLLIQSGWIHL